MKNNCLCCSLRSYSKRWKFFRKGDDERMNIKVYGDLYKDHVGFLQILGGVLDSIYTDYYFDFKDNSSYDVFKVRFSYHIITHTEQVILEKDFVRERSMSNSSWMKMKYGLLKSFIADLFKLLMFNNDILGNPVGDLSEIINSIRENPKLIQEVAAIKKRFNIKEGFIDANGIHEYPKAVKIDKKSQPLTDGQVIYLQFSDDGKIWEDKRYDTSKYCRVSYTGKKSWGDSFPVDKLNINVPINKRN